MRILATLFDVDGTLIDSIEAALRKHQRIARLLNLELPPEVQLRTYWANPWEKLLTIIATDRNWPTGAIDRFREACLQETPAERFAAVPGATAALQQLKAQGMFLGVISNRHRASLIRRLTEAGIDPALFAAIQCLDDSPHHKPNPAVFSAIIADLVNRGIPSNAVVYVGDDVGFDLEATRQHIPPLKFIGVETGLARREDFLKAGLPPKFIIPSIAALPARLRQLAQRPS